MFRRQRWGCGYAYKKRGLGIYKGVIICVVIGIALLFLVEVQIRPIVRTVAAQKAHLAVIKLINEAVYSQLGQGLSYQQLVEIHKDDAGKIVLMQPNTIKISRLATSIAKELEGSVSSLGTEGIAIPLGLLTGLTIGADWGPSLKVNIMPMGAVSVNVRDEFSAAGINQTRHRIVFDVVAKLGLMIPFSTATTEIKNSLPIAETIIVGPIPNTYLNWQKSQEGDALQNQVTKDLLGLTDATKK